MTNLAEKFKRLEESRKKAMDGLAKTGELHFDNANERIPIARETDPETGLRYIIWLEPNGEHTIEPVITNSKHLDLLKDFKEKTGITYDMTGSPDKSIAMMGADHVINRGSTPGYGFGSSPTQPIGSTPGTSAVYPYGSTPTGSYNAYSMGSSGPDPNRNGGHGQGGDGGRNQ